MKNGYYLVELKNIECAKDNNSMVTSVDYDIISCLGVAYREDEVADICTQLNLSDEILMIVEVYRGKVANCCHMVFNNNGKWWLDCCEHDFRVYASVAFDEDLT